MEPNHVLYEFDHGALRASLKGASAHHMIVMSTRETQSRGATHALLYAILPQLLRYVMHCNVWLKTMQRLLDITTGKLLHGHLTSIVASATVNIDNTFDAILKCHWVAFYKWHREYHNKLCDKCKTKPDVIVHGIIIAIQSDIHCFGHVLLTVKGNCVRLRAVQSVREPSRRWYRRGHRYRTHDTHTHIYI